MNAFEASNCYFRSQQINFLIAWSFPWNALTIPDHIWLKSTCFMRPACLHLLLAHLHTHTLSPEGQGASLPWHCCHCPGHEYSSQPRSDETVKTWTMSNYCRGIQTKEFPIPPLIFIPLSSKCLLTLHSLCHSGVMGHLLL